MSMSQSTPTVGPTAEATDAATAAEAIATAEAAEESAPLLTGSVSPRADMDPAAVDGSPGLLKELRRAYAREAVPGHVPRPFTPAERARMSRYESVDAYEPETTLFKDYLETRSHEPRWFIWCLVVALGLATSVVAAGVVCALHISQRARWEALAFGLRAGAPRATTGSGGDSPSSSHPPLSARVSSALARIDWRATLRGESAPLSPLPAPVSLWGGYAAVLAFSLLLATIAALVAALVPEAVGAGVPEVLAYFNGVAYGAMGSGRVLAARLALVILTVASGVAGAGHYGPLMLAGAMLGAQTLRRRRWVRLQNLNFVDCFRNPRDERIVVMVGAAAGLASVLSVSVGGLLVTLELLTTVLPTHFALYVFVACLVACLAMQSYMSYAAFLVPRDRAAVRAAMEVGPDGSTVTTNTTTPDALELFSSMAVHFRTELPFGEHVRVNVLQFLPAVVLGLASGWLAAAYIRLSWLALWGRRRVEVWLGAGRLVRLGLPVVFTGLCVTVQFLLLAIVLRSASGVDGGRGGGYEDGCVPLPRAIATTRAVSAIGYYGLTGLVCGGGAGPAHAADPPASSSSSSSSQLPPAPAPARIHAYASLVLANPDAALQLLLSVRTETILTASNLATYVIVQGLLSAASAGVALTLDTVLPPLLVGAALGRLGGIGVHRAAHACGGPDVASWADPGVFALVGAGSFLSGTSGLTFSVAAILMETTGDFHHLLPLMIGISVARKTTELLAHDLHDVYLSMRCVPMLRFGSWAHRLMMFDARHVMAPVPDSDREEDDGDTGTGPDEGADDSEGAVGQGRRQGPGLALSAGRRRPTVVGFPTIVTVRALATALVTTLHNAFPVVGLTDGTYKGLVTRGQLELVLWLRSLADHSGAAVATPTYEVLCRRLPDFLFHERLRTSAQSWRALLPDGFPGSTEHAPQRYTSERRGGGGGGGGIHYRPSGGARSGLCPLSPAALDALVDLSPYLDRSAVSTLRTTTLSRVCELFTTLGLRHLVVVDEANLVVGMLTRKDLVLDRLLERARVVNTHRRARQDARRRARLRPRAAAGVGGDDGERVGLALPPTCDPSILTDWIVVDGLGAHPTGTPAPLMEEGTADSPGAAAADDPLAWLPLHPRPAQVAAAALRMRQRRRAAASRDAAISSGSALTSAAGGRAQTRARAASTLSSLAQ